MKKKKELKPILPQTILELSQTYISKTFLIRFCEEEVDLNEVCNFRTEFDAFPDFTDVEFFLEGELFFCDLNNLVSQNVKQRAPFDDVIDKRSCCVRSIQNSYQLQD